MSKNYFASLTDEEREKLRQKAQESREAKKLAGAHLRQEYADKDYHKQLASEAGIRLPQMHIPNTEMKYLKRAMRVLGVNPKDYLEDCGATTLKKLAEMNPLMTAHEEVGLLLEWAKEMK